MTATKQYVPQLSTQMKQLISTALEEVHTHLTGRVVSYDPTLRRADILPLTRQRTILSDDAVLEQSLPVIPSVRVAWPGNGRVGLHMGLEPGDLVLLAFMEQESDLALARGEPTSPQSARRFDLADAICYPMNPVDTPVGDGVTAYIGTQAAGGLYVNEDGSISVGLTPMTAVDPVATETRVAAAFAGLVAAIAAAPIVPTDGGASFKAALGAYFLTTPWVNLMAGLGSDKLTVDP